MKRLKVVLVALFIFLFFSCDAAYKNDSEVFGNFDPVALQGDPDTDYFVTSAENPERIYLWQRINKNTNNESAKLVYIYNFSLGKIEDRNARAIMPVCVAFLRGNIWLCGHGRKLQLMRINVETGKLTFLKLDCTPESVVVIPKIVDGKGTLWCATCASPGIGIAIRQLDDEGNIIHKYNVKHPDIDTRSLEGLQYYNNSYFLCSSSYLNYTLNDINNGTAKYKLISLSKDSDTYEIYYGKYSDVLSQTILSSTRFTDKSEILTAFWFYNPRPYVFPNLIGDDLNYRFVCPIHFNGNELQIDEVILSYHNENNDFEQIVPYYFLQKDNNMYAIGNTRCVKGTIDPQFDGFEMHKYDTKTGKFIKRFFLPQSKINNSLCPTITYRDDKVWLGKSEYTQDETTLEWSYKGIGVYCFDEVTEELFFIDKDGNKTLIEGIDVK